MRKLTIRARILIVLVLVAIASAGASAFAALHLGRQALERTAFNKLTAVRELKAGQAEDYFRQIQNQAVVFSDAPMIVEATRGFRDAYRSIADDVTLDAKQRQDMDQSLRRYYEKEFLPRLSANMADAPSLPEFWPTNSAARLLQGLYIAENPFEAGSKQLFDRSGDGSRYSELHAKYHPRIREFLERFGYYDIFLVDHETGEILYSVSKEVDFATSLLHGPYRDTNLAAAFRAAKDARDRNFLRLEDFQPYPPSYNAAASFIASPVFDGDEQIGVAVLQMPVDRLDRILTSDRSWRDVGLGESGESYIVAEDFTMRTQSRFLIEDRERYLEQLRQADMEEAMIRRIASLGSTIGIQEVRTPGTEQALAGTSGTLMFEDYRGLPVLSAFRPLDITDVHWVLVSEMDRAEAFAGIRALQRSMLVVLALVVGGSVLLAILFSRGLIRPLRGLSERANELAEGRLDVEIDTRREDEIGQLARSFDSMRKSLKSLVERQEASIDALSAPLIPLRAGIALMPLVGEFDRGRVERLRETLVQGIYEEGARAIIIDVTGIRVFDPELGRGLAQVSAAARLLGAEVVLTGVQPGIARGLADAGERLSDVATRRTLQEGIDFALNHLSFEKEAR
jgi:methyl-accepting chemotaxis protein